MPELPSSGRTYGGGRQHGGRVLGGDSYTVGEAGPETFVPDTVDELAGPFEARLEVRDLERREVWGRIIPIGEEIRVRGRPESFAPGALDGIDASRVRLLDHHRRAIGRIAGEIEERSDGFYAAFRISRTTAGDEMLELVSDGVIDSFSPGFIPGEQDAGGVHRRLKALPEVSLVTFPAYDGAKILAMREVEMPETETTETVTPVTETREADYEELERRMSELSSQLERALTMIEAPAPAPARGGPSPFGWFVGELRAELNISTRERENWHDQFETYRETRASTLEDVTGVLDLDGTITDGSGLIAEEYLAGQLANVVDTRRPLLRRLGNIGMPRSGFARIPIVTQHTEVGPRGAQKSEIPSRKMIVTTAPFEAEWLAGGVDVALELIRTSEISVLDLVWNDLLGQYAIASEAALVEGIDGGLAPYTGFTYTGTALLDATPTYAEFATAVATQVSTVRTATGRAPDLLAVTTADWIKLVAMVDSGGRRIFAPIGQENADGSVSFTAESFTLVGGIEVFEVPGLAASLLTNGEALRGVDGGPERVQAVNVSEMGVDIGLLGRTFIVPRIPAGVVVFGTDPTP